MITALFLLATANAQVDSVTPAGQPAFVPFITSSFTPEAAAVGESVVWTVRVDDRSRAGAELSEFEFGVEWALLEGPEDVVEPGVARSGRPDILRRWTLLPLVGGALGTPEFTVSFDDGEVFPVPPATIEIAAALGENEDAPRPFEGFREAPDRRVGNASTALLALGALVLAMVGLVVWRKTRRAGGAAPVRAEESPLDLMHSLRERLESGAEPPASVMAALGPLFRRAFDRPLEENERERRSALTDDAWAGETDAARPGGEDAARLVSELSAYRYGGGLPTSFAAKDALERATTLARASSARSVEATDSEGGEAA